MGRMTGTSDYCDSSSLSEMESGISAVTSLLFDSLSECTEIDKELSSMTGAIVDTLGEINSFVDNIEKIGTEIELLSLNARIMSAHTGNEGIGLSVIAEEIHILSDDVCKKTSEISETLKEMLNSIYVLKIGIDSGSDHRNGDVEGMIRDLGRLSDLLRNLNGSVSNKVKILNPMAGELAKDIRRSINGISVHRSAAAGIDCAVLELDEIIFSLPRLSPTEESYNTDVYRDIESRYTMQHEREIHRLHLKSEEDLVRDNLFSGGASEKSDNILFFR